MNFKTLLLTAILFVGFGIQSCEEDYCDCCTVGEYRGFFDIQDVQVSHWDSTKRPIDQAILRYEDYGFINMHFVVDYVVHQESRGFDFSFMSSAYGCSPESPGVEGSKEEALESLQIITINDFDDEHKAGESINDLLEFNDIRFGGAPVLLESYLDSLTGNVPTEYFVLGLLKEPEIDKNFQVRAEMQLSTGEYYEATSPLISFQ